MVSLLYERFVLWKLRKKLCGEVRNTIKEIYADREIRSKNESSATFVNDAFDRRSPLLPTRCAFDKRNACSNARLDIPFYGVSGRKIDRDIRATQLIRQIDRRKARARLVYDARDLMPTL